MPFLRDPPRNAHLAGFEEWRAAGKAVMNLTIAGSTHLDYSPGPALPASSWCPSIENNACVGGWAKPVIIHYTTAWFDRWLKQEGEQGYEDADQRLLDDAKWVDRLSFHFASARSFPDRGGKQQEVQDIRLQ